MRGLVVAGSRTPKGIQPQIKNAGIKTYPGRGVARAAGFRVRSTAVDESKCRPSRDVDRLARNTDSGRS